MNESAQLPLLVRSYAWQQLLTVYHHLMNMSYVHTVKSSLLTLTHSGCTITAQFLRNLISRTSRKQLKPISARAAAAPPPSSVIHRVTDGGESSCAAVLLLGRPKLSDRRHCVNMVRMIVGIPRFQAHFIPEVFGLVANRIRRGEKGLIHLPVAFPFLLALD